MSALFGKWAIRLRPLDGGIIAIAAIRRIAKNCPPKLTFAPFAPDIKRDQPVQFEANRNAPEACVFGSGRKA